jgi:hypothetical protein
MMEGTGAANLPATKDRNFSHGTQMVSLVLRLTLQQKLFLFVLLE